MKRFLILFMILGLVAGSMATAEAKGRARVERTVEGNYSPTPPDQIYRCTAPSDSSTCVVVETRPMEAFFTAKVTDVHGQPVYVEVHGSGIPRGTSFCGETTGPVRFEPGTKLEFRIEPMPYVWATWGTDWTGPLDCPYRIKTTGSISVTLSNQP